MAKVKFPFYSLSARGTLITQAASPPRVVAPSLTPDSYTLTPAKPAPRLAERGFSFV